MSMRALNASSCFWTQVGSVNHSTIASVKGHSNNYITNKCIIYTSIYEMCIRTYITYTYYVHIRDNPASQFTARFLSIRAEITIIIFINVDMCTVTFRHVVTYGN